MSSTANGRLASDPIRSACSVAAMLRRAAFSGCRPSPVASDLANRRSDGWTPSTVVEEAPSVWLISQSLTGDRSSWAKALTSSSADLSRSNSAESMRTTVPATGGGTKHRYGTRPPCGLVQIRSTQCPAMTQPSHRGSDPSAGRPRLPPSRSSGALTTFKLSKFPQLAG